jgi:hypothetical protein
MMNLVMHHTGKLQTNIRNGSWLSLHKTCLRMDDRMEKGEVRCKPQRRWHALNARWASIGEPHVVPAQDGMLHASLRIHFTLALQEEHAVGLE